MAKEMGLDRAPIEFQTFYISHELLVPPNYHAQRSTHLCNPLPPTHVYYSTPTLIKIQLLLPFYPTHINYFAAPSFDPGEQGKQGLGANLKDQGLGVHLAGNNQGLGGQRTAGGGQSQRRQQPVEKVRFVMIGKQL